MRASAFPVNYSAMLFIFALLIVRAKPDLGAASTTTTRGGTHTDLYNESHSAFTLLRGDELVGLYEFNEGDGRDTSPVGFAATSDGKRKTAYGHDGILSSGILPIANGYVGKGLYFHGNDFVRFDIDINPYVLPQVSMGAWVKTASINSKGGDGAYDLARHLLTHDDGGKGFDRGVGIDSRSGSLGWSAYRGPRSGTGVLGALPVKLGEWQFVAVVYDSTAGTVLLYVDGETLKGKSSCAAGNTFLSLGKSSTERVGFHGSIYSG